ncbi:MAG: hypothetical protein RBS39_02050 [Phycisphaerales bacterium]|jgi:hypothetical protein|nr:hypothetical protein [Phycisphaerales bacterium]
MIRTRVSAAALRMCACGLVAVTSALALAKPPAVLDRIPGDALIVVTVPDMARLNKDVKAFGTASGAPMDNMEPLQMVTALLDTPGLNASGGAALAVMSLPNGGEAEPQMVLVAPVKDFAQMVRGLGGEPGSGVVEAQAMGENVFLKDIGGGYAVLGPSRDVVESFDGAGGRMETHVARLGKTGDRITSASDITIVANVEGLRPMIQQGMEQFKNQMEMMAMMMGPQAAQMEQSFAMMQAVGDAFQRDATVGLIGFDMSAEGIAIDMGANFRAGSPSASLMQGSGDSSKLTSRLPDMPFLFAFAADMKNAGLRGLMREVIDLQKQAMPDAAQMSFLKAEMFEKVDGMTGMWGSPQSLMGAVFANSVIFQQCSDPASVMGAAKEAMAAMDGKTIQGVTYKTSYTAGGATVGDRKVDTWSMRASFDMNNPNAMQMQQAAMMMWGAAGGPSGYIAPTKNGYVQTFAPNSDLTGKAIAAAEAGNGLGAGERLKAAAANLPKDRSFEAYVGVKDILDTVTLFMGMMGMQMEQPVPDKITPIAMGGVMGDGGVFVRTYAPASTIKTIADMIPKQGGGGAGMDDDDAEF